MSHAREILFWIAPTLGPQIIWTKPDGKESEKAILDIKGDGTGVNDIGRLSQADIPWVDATMVKQAKREDTTKQGKLI